MLKALKKNERKNQPLKMWIWLKYNKIDLNTFKALNFCFISKCKAMEREFKKEKWKHLKNKILKECF